MSLRSRVGALEKRLKATTPRDTPTDAMVCFEDDFRVVEVLATNRLGEQIPWPAEVPLPEGCPAKWMHRSMWEAV